jgi:HD superfamily phosphohydrolase
VGIGGVSRYEHSLGTAVLAYWLARQLALDEDFERELVLSASLHDVAAPALGHLFEEACHIIGMPFNHEAYLRSIVLEEGFDYSQVYLGREMGARKFMAKYRISPVAVFDAICGQGRCGNAINGSMDLDNIDNIARMLWRLGHPINGEDTRWLLNAFGLVGNNIALRHDCAPHYEMWANLRRELYNILMLEPTDFSAKTMTKLAIVRGLETGLITANDWHSTDSEMFQKLLSHDATRVFVERLLLGDYFRMIGMYWVEGDQHSATPGNSSMRSEVRRAFVSELGQGVEIDFIADKRERQHGGTKPVFRALFGVMSERKTMEAGMGRRREKEVCDQLVRALFPRSSAVSIDDSTMSSDLGIPERQAHLFQDKD